MKNLSRAAMALLFLFLGLTILFSGCTRAETGQVLIKTKSTGIDSIVRPSSGYVSTEPMTPGTQFQEFDVKVWTYQRKIDGQTKDNAKVSLEIQMRLLPPQSDDDIKKYANHFGLKPEERDPRVNEFLSGALNTEGKNAIAAYEAYALLANQSAIQAKLYEVLLPKLQSQGWLKLESIELIGSPDFADDRIENAASAVVAATKEQEAAQAKFAAAEIQAKTKELEARSYANPGLLELEKYRISNQAQVEIEKARADGMARHNGPLTVVNGSSSPQLQLRPNAQ